MIQKVKTFFTDARTELRHVNWPTREEAIRLTLIVISISLVLAAFLGAADALFALGIKEYIIQ